MKIYRKGSTKVMILILLTLVVTVGLIFKFGTKDKPITSEWKQELIAENQQYQKQVEQSNSGPEKKYYQKEIAKNEYRIDHNVKPVSGKNIWNFTNEMTGMTQLIIIFTIIVVSTSISSEFTWGTIKLLLIRPVSRTTILLAKYVSSLIYSIFMILLLFAFSWFIGGILFGFGGADILNLQYVNGHVQEINWVLYEFKQYGLLCVQLIVMVTLAASIASIFRNSSLAIGLSIFLTMAGSIIIQFLSQFEWVKYVLFVNMDLNQYIDGIPFREDMTMGFSLSVLAVYYLIFAIFGWLFFTKRDVAS